MSAFAVTFGPKDHGQTMTVDRDDVTLLVRVLLKNRCKRIEIVEIGLTLPPGAGEFTEGTYYGNTFTRADLGTGSA